MPTVGLPNLPGYLATVGGAGITMLLYAQALPQIEDVYGEEAALSILSNCTSQLFFPPREPHTAELISRAFGSSLKVPRQTTGVAPLSWTPEHWGRRAPDKESTCREP